MTIVSKLAGGASVVSSLYDIHKTALIFSKNSAVKASANATIACSLGTQKSDTLSYRDSIRKNWVNKNNFFAGAKEILGGVCGYFKGVKEGIIRYAPGLILGIAAFLAKNKTFANISTVALAAIEGYDFIKNGTDMFQRKDYLKL